MKNPLTSYYLLLIFGVLFGSVSCTPEIRLGTQGAQALDVTGNYTAIYYGCNFLNDLETIAFLQREDSKYHFEPFAPDFQYRVRKGLSAKEAMETALQFVSCNTSFNRAQVSGIIGPDNETIGYEVRPLYQPFAYGGGDVIQVNYGLRDGKVVIYVRPLDTMLQDGGVSRKER